jgi:hypothetical protein
MTSEGSITAYASHTNTPDHMLAAHCWLQHPNGSMHTIRGKLPVQPITHTVLAALPILPLTVASAHTTHSPQGRAHKQPAMPIVQNRKGWVATPATAVAAPAQSTMPGTISPPDHPGCATPVTTTHWSSMHTTPYWFDGTHPGQEQLRPCQTCRVPRWPGRQQAGPTAVPLPLLPPRTITTTGGAPAEAAGVPYTAL